MAHFAGIGGKVARGAEEHAGHVHELGEGEVQQQHADEGQMHEEERADAVGGHGREVHQTHDEDLDLGDVGLVEVAHADAAQNDAQDEEQGEVVVHQGDVAQALVEQAAGQQEEHGHQQQAAGPVEARAADLHDAVDAFHEGQPAGHRIHEETEVADEDQQEAVMEQQGKEPQPLGRVVDGAGALVHRVEFTHVGRGVAEQRTEEADFQEHADHHTELGVGAVPLFLFDEVQRLFLTPGRGDAERHGRFGPVNHAPDDAQEEGDYRHIGQNHAEQVRQTNGRTCPGNGPDERHHQQ